jgi:hypothetical protein
MICTANPLLRSQSSSIGGDFVKSVALICVRAITCKYRAEAPGKNSRSPQDAAIGRQRKEVPVK